MVAIGVNNITKVYKLFDRPIDRLKESLRPGHKEYHKKFYALNHISFEVEDGQFVGIIGTNGSGKSTILKIITGVLTPTDGTLIVNGRISALLELGAGFNMEYTGIENIYMNGTMMGYSRQEMNQKLPEILDFAEIGDFVYQPVKTYSSGMFVRLAFALAINVDPDILIVDEALAVGDVFFQAKCYKKINEIREGGTTVLLVTHDMGTIIKYCDKVIVLNQGHFVAEGEPGKMVDLYKKILAGQFDERDLEGIGQKADFADKLFIKAEVCTKEGAFEAAEGEGFWMQRLNINKGQLNYGTGTAQIIDLGIFDHKGELTNLLLKGKTFKIKMKVRFAEMVCDPIFAFTIKDSKGTEITGTNSMIEGCDTGAVQAGDVVTAIFEQNMDLQGKDYLLSLGCTGYVNGAFVVFDRLYDVVNLTVISDKNTVGYYDMNSRVVIKRQERME